MDQRRGRIRVKVRACKMSEQIHRAYPMTLVSVLQWLESIGVLMCVLLRKHASEVLGQ